MINLGNMLQMVYKMCGSPAVGLQKPGQTPLLQITDNGL